MNDGLEVGTPEGWEEGCEVGNLVGLRVRCTPLMSGAEVVGMLVVGLDDGCEEGCLVGC